MTGLALPLLALLTLHATTFEVGASPRARRRVLIVALPAGAWVDRWRKRWVLIWGDAGRVAVLGSIPLAKELGVLTLGQLYVVALLTGVLTVFFDACAYQSYLPVLVEPDQLIDGNGKLGASQAFGQVAGPGLGGLLVGAVGAAYAVVADAASFAVSTIATLMIRRPEPPPPRSCAEGRRLRTEIREGLHFVVTHPILRQITGCTATNNFFGGGVFFTLVAVSSSAICTHRPVSSVSCSAPAAWAV